MKHPVTNELYAYWRRLKGDRAAPAHTEIDWVALRRLAANIVIIQKDARKNYWISYAGTRIEALWLAERDGRRFLDLWDEADRGGVLSAIDSVVEIMAPIVAGIRCAPPGAKPVDLEFLLLPLRRPDQADAQFLGSLSLAHEPDWFGRTGVGRLKLFSFRVIREQERIAAARLRRPAAPIALHEPAQERPKLVVHKGGKL